MIRKLTIGLLFGILLLSPLPLGSNRPLAEAVLTIAAALALMGWGWSGALMLEWRQIRWIGLCFGAVLIWAAIQMPLSVDTSASLLALLLLATYAALFALAFQLGRDHQTARQFVRVMAFSAAFYAAYGLAVYALGNDHILWFEKWAYPDSLTGTFVNRNAFAAYAGMGLLACLALVAHAIGREDGNLRLALKTASTTLPTSLLGGSVLMLAIILSGSRAGIVSIGAGLTALWFGLWLSHSLPRRALVLLALCGLLAGGSAIAVVGERLVQRSAQAELMRDDRPQIWLASLHMIKDAPLTGYGAGTYDQIFLQYRTPAIKQNYTKAHSTYLEMAATLGVPAALVFFAGFALVGLFLLRGIHIRRQHKIYPVLAFAVLVQAATHSLVDFSFQTPANAAILAMVLGVGMAQSFSAEQR